MYVRVPKGEEEAQRLYENKKTVHGSRDTFMKMMPTLSLALKKVNLNRKKVDLYPGTIADDFVCRIEVSRINFEET